MSKWIDFSIDERMAMVYVVTQAKRIDEAAAERIGGDSRPLCSVSYQR